ncbi:MAG: hypothetical protein WC029_11030 [Sulfuricella sp.]|jgi:hypothetical protein
MNVKGNGRMMVVSHHLAVDGFSALAGAMLSTEGLEADLVVLTNKNAEWAARNLPIERVHSFERHYEQSNGESSYTVDELRRRYAKVPWGTVVASERSFSDYSFLLGGTGYRPERDDYIVPLVARFVAFFDQAIARFQPRAVITAFGDNIFTYIAAVVAEENGIPVFLPQPSFLNEGGVMESGYFGNTRYLESFAMIRCYLDMRSRPLTEEERRRAERFVDVLLGYEGNKTLSYIYKKKDFEKPVTPQRGKLLSYLLDNAEKDRNVEFYKISAGRKLHANLLRVYRLWRLQKFIAAQQAEIPSESVLFAMHFQPEASTLVNGIWYSNQIALIETLSKALPLGYTLVVKEHPRGRGMRPLWQYRHIVGLHNVIISDAPSKEIVRRCQMVVSVSGSIGLEALALGKPVLMLGRTFHTFNTLYYRVEAVEELPRLFHRVLLGCEFEHLEGRQEEVYRFLLAYLDSLYPFFPVNDKMARLIPHILQELDEDQDAPRVWLDGLFGNGRDDSGGSGSGGHAS